jgi:hypothetical protein
LHSTQAASTNKIIRQAEELKAKVHSHAARTDENFKVGVEIEVCLIDGRGIPVDARPVIELLEQHYRHHHHHNIDFEYGRC